MPTVGFEPTISAAERPQTYDLHRAATGTGKLTTKVYLNTETTLHACKLITIFFVAQRSNTGHGLLIFDDSRSHTTLHSR
jgi:hypothetical protein